MRKINFLKMLGASITFIWKDKKYYFVVYEHAFVINQLMFLLRSIGLDFIKYFLQYFDDKPILEIKYQNVGDILQKFRDKKITQSTHTNTQIEYIINLDKRIFIIDGRLQYAFDKEILGPDFENIEPLHYGARYRHYHHYSLSLTYLGLYGIDTPSFYPYMYRHDFMNFIRVIPGDELTLTCGDKSHIVSKRVFTKHLKFITESTVELPPDVFAQIPNVVNFLSALYYPKEDFYGLILACDSLMLQGYFARKFYDNYEMYVFSHNDMPRRIYMNYIDKALTKLIVKFPTDRYFIDLAIERTMKIFTDLGLKEGCTDDDIDNFASHYSNASEPYITFNLFWKLTRKRYMNLNNYVPYDAINYIHALAIAEFVHSVPVFPVYDNEQAELRKYAEEQFLHSYHRLSRI